MGAIYLLCVAILFSFGGIYGKSISPYFSAEYITLFRFVFGVVFLLLLKALSRKRFSRDLPQKIRQCLPWLVFGGAAKVMAYLTENTGILKGASYGVILTQPAQTVFLTCLSIFVLREKLSWKKLIFIAPCILGVLIVSWNGKPLDDFVSGNLGLLGLFAISGVFAGCHVFAQKKVADKMDIIESNLIMFSISAVLSLLPLGLPTAHYDLTTHGLPDLMCIVAILMFGVNTGIGFYLNAKAIPLVPFYMVPIIQSTMAIFAIIWSVLFFPGQEQVTIWVGVGTAVFILGILGLQLAGNQKPQRA